MTGMLHGSRISKASLRIDVIGNVDELNAALGVVRIFASNQFFKDEQNVLVKMMGQLSSQNKNLIDECEIKRLNEIGKQLENETNQNDWANPGSDKTSALIDFAVRVCRRAERSCWRLIESDEAQPHDKLVAQYLNRLSDVLWMSAR